MKALLVFLLIWLHPVSASDTKEMPESGTESNTPAVLAAEEAKEETKRDFSWLGVSLAGSGTAAIIASQTIAGNEAGTLGLGVGIVLSGCAVVWKALPSKKSKK